MLPRPSALGDGPARLRRAFLHKRLLQIVRKHHETFVKTHENPKPHGAVWHPDFDPDSHVPALPAPPLCTKQPTPPAQPPPHSLHSSHTSKPGTESSTTPCALSRDTEAKADTSQGGSDAGGEVDIPKDLLARVRSRQKAKEARTEQAEAERACNHSLLSKLPCTMDSINTVLRMERRSAIGWRQLVNKVATVHPRKWPKEDIERQLDAIVKIATQWCSKVELKSSRGGYAFRVISEKGFAEARAAVLGTTSFSTK